MAVGLGVVLEVVSYPAWDNCYNLANHVFSRIRPLCTFHGRLVGVINGGWCPLGSLNQYQGTSQLALGDSLEYQLVNLV